MLWNQQPFTATSSKRLSHIRRPLAEGYTHAYIRFKHWMRAGMGKHGGKCEVAGNDVGTTTSKGAGGDKDSRKGI